MAILFVFFNTNEVECFHICLLINCIFTSELPIPFLCSFDLLYKGKKMMSFTPISSDPVTFWDIIDWYKIIKVNLVYENRCGSGWKDLE